MRIRFRTTRRKNSLSLRTGLPRRRQSVFLTLLAVPALLISLSCWDNDFVSNQPVSFEREPWTPSKFMGIVARAYDSENLETYQSLLDADYQYHFLPADPEEPENHPVWGIAEEVASAKNIFLQNKNASGAYVIYVELDINTIDTTLYTVELPGGGGEEIRYSVSAEVDLSAMIKYRKSGGGSGYFNYVVNSTQEFILRPHPEKKEQFLILEQFDGPPGDVDESIQYDSTEVGSWGEMKSRFRYERAPGVWGLLEDHFVDVYTSRDSSAYDDLLDPFYEFELLPDDPYDTLNVETWDRSEELRIAGRMFGGWENEEGIRVQAIDIEQMVQQMTITTTIFPDQPEGEEWYYVNCGLFLTVVAHDPTAADGTGIVNWQVLSLQDYVTRPDPDGLNTWIIRRQIDGHSISDKGASGSGSDNRSWGDIKSLFQ